MSFGDYLASGSYYDKFVFIWDIKEEKQIGIINCRGPINNIFLTDSNKMIINSDEGVFLQSINLADMKCFSTVSRVKNITSDYICFFKDGDRFIAGCEQNLLIESRLSEYMS